jgi:hypothetical protein
VVRRSAEEIGALVKDQYFGDVNDYAKYTLLRRVAGTMPLAVCFMRTPADDRGDGRHVSYLGRPDLYRHTDPDLFDTLLGAADTPRRVSNVRELRILPDAVLYDKPLPPALPERERYFADFRRAANGCAVAFFDPDNGLSVPSVPRTSSSASRYLFDDELRWATEAGLSVIVYQHFPRTPRHEYAVRLARRLAEVTLLEAWAMYTSRVAYGIAAQDHHRPSMRAVLDPLADCAPRFSVAPCVTP